MALSDVRKAEHASDNHVNEEELDFFKVKMSNEGYVKEVQILQTGFLRLLRRLGFRRYDVAESFIVVRIHDNVIEQIFPHRLREIIVRHFVRFPDEIGGCPKDMLLEKLIRSLGTLTTDEKLSLLVDLEDDDHQIEIVEDTADKAYYFYENGFVEVSKSGWELKPYKDLPGFIWKDQIIPRQFKKLRLKEIEQGVYWKFARMVSGDWGAPDAPRKQGEIPPSQNETRLNSFLTITGYNLHRFFKTKLRCTIFMDSRVGDDPDGRSGKSLHCKAMWEILNADPISGKQCITIDGKKYDEQNRFNLDELHISTRLVVFDDIKRGFVIENFFNAIVDGLVRERKGDVNKARIFSKIIFTLNYTIQIRGGSAKDRVIEFEFADYFSSRHQPETEFGHWFFRDWDAEEYNRFDNFMCLCVCEYLKAGIIMPDTINLEQRKLRDETALEFISWMEDLEIAHCKEYEKRALYRQFLDINDEGKPMNRDFHLLKQRQFTKWLQLYATYRPEFAGFKEWRSSGTDKIVFFYNEPAPEDLLRGAVVFPGKSANLKPSTEKDLPF